VDKPGATIGPFEVLRELGRGGMGVVYLARDTRLERQVAIKALPEQLVSDADRLARFEREAKILASLSHPGIAGVHALEQHAGQRYLIMEFIEGESLAERLGAGPVPIDEAIDLASQIAGALEAAHEKGVIHRDLKPANIMVTPEGRAKVLDFGLARGTPGVASSEAPTLLSPARAPSPTLPGAIMGTAGYMSPEQARGKPVDTRSDVFAFGCVLYEMLTGKCPFPGETITDALAASLRAEPTWADLPHDTPARVRLLLKRCLAKDRANRLQHIGDARLELLSGADDPAPVLARESSRWKAVSIVALALCAGLAIFAAWAARRPAASPAPLVRFEIDPFDTLITPPIDDAPADLTLDRTGTCLAFSAESGGIRRIYVRDFSEPGIRAVPGTEGGSDPFFSPDARTLGFRAAGRYQRVPVAGGPVVTICTASGGSAAWLDDGTIVFAGTESLWRVPAQGGTPRQLATAGPSQRTTNDQRPVLGFISPTGVPGRSYVLAGVWDGDTIESYSIVSVSLTDGSIRSVVRNAAQPMLLAPDQLAFFRRDTIMTVPFDASSGSITAEPATAVTGVRTNTWADAGRCDASNGTLVYTPGARRGAGRRLIRVTPQGVATPLTDAPDDLFGGLRVSPDGEQALYITLRRKLELWNYDTRSRTASLVDAVGEVWWPLWTPDGASIVFARHADDGAQLIRRPARTTGAAEHLPLPRHNDASFAAPGAITPDGDFLIYVQHAGIRGDIDIMRWRESEPSRLHPLIATEADEHSTELSPDARSLVYVSTESGQPEVYVVSWPDLGAKRKVSARAGGAPRWSRDGKTIFYTDREDNLLAAEFSPADGKVGPSRTLFKMTGLAATDLEGEYDVFPNGDFLMAAPAPWESERPRLRVILNWRGP